MDEYILILLLIFSGVDGNFCPKCETVKCISTLSSKNCSTGEYPEPNGGLCNCCPGCVTNRLGLNEFGCDTTYKCGPGLRCDEYKICRLDKTKCSHLQHIKELYNWLPECNNDGTYKPVQCKGDRATGRCFCFGEQGDRIFGWDFWRNAAEMTCACSRLRNKRNADGKISTLHCARNGNFEELQCEQNVCWCSEPKTGVQASNTIAVPSDMWMLLPCYNAELMGEQYLRVCESGAHAEEIMSDTFRNRGAEIRIKTVYCDYDGSCASVHMDNEIYPDSATCRWRDGSRIGVYGAPNTTSMDCNCARDQQIFEQNGIALSLHCDTNGNYRSMQEFNLYRFCVDRDGFAVTKLLSLTQNIDCSTVHYYP